MNDTKPYTIHLVSPTPKFSPKELLAPELEIVVLKRAAVHFGFVDADHALSIVAQGLKRLVDEKKLMGRLRFDADGNATFRTVVSLVDLWKCAQAYGSAPHLTWLRPLCDKWAAVRGVALESLDHGSTRESSRGAWEDLLPEFLAIDPKYMGIKNTRLVSMFRAWVRPGITMPTGDDYVAKAIGRAKRKRRTTVAR